MHDTQNLTALALLLAAAVGCGLGMTRLRLPAAAGFILVGAGLGPSGAGLLDTSTSINTLAELGVLMLLFIIGMEMRLAQFAKSLPLALGYHRGDLRRDPRLGGAVHPGGGRRSDWAGW